MSDWCDYCRSAGNAAQARVWQRDAEIARLRAEVERLRAAAEAYRELTVCYRVGKQPSDALWKRLDAAKAARDGGGEGT